MNKLFYYIGILIFGFFALHQSVYATADITITEKSSTMTSITVSIKNNGVAGTTNGVANSIFYGKAFATNPATGAQDGSVQINAIPGGGVKDVTISSLKQGVVYNIEVNEGGLYGNIIKKITVSTKGTPAPTPTTTPPPVQNQTQTPAGGGTSATPARVDPPVLQNTSAATTTATATDTAAGGRFVAKNDASSGQSSGFLLDVKLQNPLKVDNITDAVKFFVDTLIKIAIPVIVIFFIWAGLKFILAQGKPDKIKEAKQMFWYTIIGTLLILGAWTITNAIIGTVNSITG